MKNPNQGVSEDVLRRLRDASYERMRIELKCNIESLMEEFGFTWDDIGRLLGMTKKVRGGTKTRADVIRYKVIQGSLTLKDLNMLAHLFSCEPYIIFRPRLPWTKS